jgi:hypothetical protein
LPVFVSFTDATNTALLILPTTSLDTGTFSITVTLNDGIDSTEYVFLITVSTAPSPMSQALMNLGPPIFMAALVD